MRYVVVHDAATKRSFMIVLYAEMMARNTSKYRVMYTMEKSSWLFPLIPAVHTSTSQLASLAC
jgi:hypothetical protein